MVELKAASKTDPKALAGSIAKIFRDAQTEGKNIKDVQVDVHGVGPLPNNQALKAIAIARGYLAPVGIDLICSPSFVTIKINDEDRTAMVLRCEAR